MNKLIRQTSPEWLEEIQLVVADGREVAPFGDQVGEIGDDINLFYLALVICLRFRGFDFRDENFATKSD